MTGDCLNCEHPIGYHHGGTTEENFCTVKDCQCPGYAEEAAAGDQEER